MTPPNLPPGYTRIKRVNSFHELVTTPFADGVNALCWERVLPGDFGEVAGLLAGGEGITPLDVEHVEALPVSAAGREAVEVMVTDWRRLRELGLQPELNHINGCRRDGRTGPVRTDVMSFHVDSATVETDTWLCTYHGACSEGLRNDESLRRVDIPETRAELLKLYGGEDDEAFREFLNEHCYDLHYSPLPEARPFSLGQGNLWRIAVAYPGCPVPPCIHRAPETQPGDPQRLLLIS